MGIFIESQFDTQFFLWKELKEWIVCVIEKEGFIVGDLNYSFVSDEEILEINRKFLDHDYYTDIITFDEVDYDIINGDIVISVERVVENAKELHCEYIEEFCRVVIHGVLHLCGYADRSELDVALMRKKENYYLGTRSFT